MPGRITLLAGKLLSPAVAHCVGNATDGLLLLSFPRKNSQSRSGRHVLCALQPEPSRGLSHRRLPACRSEISALVWAAGEGPGLCLLGAEVSPFLGAVVKELKV